MVVSRVDVEKKSMWKRWKPKRINIIALRNVEKRLESKLMETERGYGNCGEQIEKNNGTEN